MNLNISKFLALFFGGIILISSNAVADRIIINEVSPIEIVVSYELIQNDGNSLFFKYPGFLGADTSSGATRDFWSGVGLSSPIQSTSTPGIFLDLNSALQRYTFLNSDQIAFPEPAEAGKFNTVTFVKDKSGVITSMTVASDVGGALQGYTRETSGTFLLAQRSPDNGNSLSLTFIDTLDHINGRDGRGVPENDESCLLLAFSLIVIFTAQRLFSAREEPSRNT